MIIALLIAMNELKNSSFINLYPKGFNFTRYFIISLVNLYFIIKFVIIMIELKNSSYINLYPKGFNVTIYFIIN